LLEEDQFTDQQNTVVRLFENDPTDDNMDPKFGLLNPLEMLFNKLLHSIGGKF
jgi:hypothetical protein